MKAALAYSFKLVFVWIKEIAMKGAKKAFFIAVILFGLGLVGLLPQSPFRVLNNAIMSEQAQASNLLRYIPVFIPVHEMLAFLSVWVVAVGVWYGVKVFLRATNVVS